MYQPTESELAAYQLAIADFIQKSKQQKLTDGILEQSAELDSRIKSDPVVGGLILKALLSVAIGMAVNFIASKLFGKKSSAQSSKSEQQYAPIYGFEEGGAIPEANQVIPLIYCNRRVNPFGGYRANGYLLFSNINIAMGKSTLRQLHALAMGELGEINTDKALIAEQPRDLYSDRDVKLTARNGTEGQIAIAGFDYYSQAVSPANYNSFGVDWRTALGESISAEPPATPGIVTAPGGEQWSIEPGGTKLQSRESASSGDFRSLTLSRLFNSYRVDQIFLLDNTVYGSFNEGVFYLAILGNEWSDYTGQNARLILEEDYYFLRDSTYRDYGARAVLNAPGINRSTNPRPSNSEATYTVGSADYNALSSNDEYTLSGSYSNPPNTFAIVAKDWASKKITIDPAIALTSQTAAYAYYRARYETTRAVTGLDLNLAFNLSSYTPEGDPKEFGSAFELFLLDSGSPNNPDDFLNNSPKLMQPVSRFYVQAFNPSAIRRQIQIRGLPYGRYRVELRPIPPGASQAFTEVIELGEDGVLTPYQKQVAIAGSPRTITILVESRGIATAERIQAGINEDRKQPSSDSGATGRLTSVNEIIAPAAIAAPPPTYPGLAVVAAELTASERISQPPATEVLIVQGEVCWNWMSAGRTTGTGNLIDINANFLDVQTGWHAFNLDRKQMGLITNVTQHEITAAGVQWRAGDRYAIAFKASSNYFPDIFVDILWRKSEEGGLGDIFDAWRLIDYPAIAESRRFCVAKKYFWDNSIVQPKNFAQWAEQQARLSLLVPTTIGSRIGLRPIRNDSPIMTINGSNCQNFKFTSADWADQQVNKVVVKHRDGRSDWQSSGLRFRPTTTIVLTDAARSGTEPVYKVEVDADSVTHPEQVKAIACMSLRSATLQDAVCSFDMDWTACYLEPGDILRVQTESLILNDELSGIVTTIENNSFLLSKEPILFRGEFDNEKAETRSQVTLKNASAIAVGDLIRIRKNNNSLSEGSQITNVENGTIQFNPPLRCHPFDEFEILDCTFDGLYAAITSNGVTRDNLTIECDRYAENKVWLRIPGINVVEGSPVIVYRKQAKYTLWQINGMEPQKGFGAKIQCVLWNPRITEDWSGLWVRSQDGEYQIR